MYGNGSIAYESSIDFGTGPFPDPVVRPPPGNSQKRRKTSTSQDDDSTVTAGSDSTTAGGHEGYPGEIQFLTDLLLQERASQDSLRNSVIVSSRSPTQFLSRL